ncbi:MAG: carboxymuconolactone decarboxylase family protein [Pseudomonadota bacterium]
MKSRLPLPDVDRLNAQQRVVYDSILSTRGNLDGPFLAWMHSPELASRAERLGAFCRYSTELSMLESELLILLVAAHFQCDGERQIHEPIALSAGLTQSQIEAIWKGVPAQLEKRLDLLQQLSGELLRNNRISAATYSAALSDFGPQKLVEAIAVLGYYALVALTLNAFEMAKV